MEGYQSVYSQHGHGEHQHQQSSGTADWRQQYSEHRAVSPETPPAVQYTPEPPPAQTTRGYAQLAPQEPYAATTPMTSRDQQQQQQQGATYQQVHEYQTYQYDAPQPPPPAPGLAHNHTTFNTKLDNKLVHKHTWTLEIVATIIGLLSLTAAIILLVRAEGRPITEFAFFISFNTIISILGTIARSTLVFAICSCLAQGKWNWFKQHPGSLMAFEKFDEASRGPWGGFWLIVWLRFRHLAVLGSLITIVLLGMEPFLQAIIYYEGVTDVTYSFAIPVVSTSQKINVGSFKADPTSGAASIELPSGGTPSLQSFLSQPDMGMVSALYSGFFNDSLTAKLTPSFSCPTGNCTWTPYTSLGVCSACNDITGALKTEKKDGVNLGTIQVGVLKANGSYLTYRLPLSNTSLGNGQGRSNTIMSAYMTANSVYNPGLTVSFSNLKTMLIAVDMIKADKSYVERTTPWEQTKVTATECALYLCTRAYQAKVDRNQLNEVTLGSWANRKTDSFQGIEGNELTAELDQFRNYTLYGPPDQERTDLQLEIPADEARRLGLPANATLVFNVTHASVGSTIQYMSQDFFNGKSTQYPYLQMIKADEAGKIPPQPPAVQTLWDSEDLSATFGKAALTLTNWARDSSRDSMPGEGREWVVHFRVRWPYLTLPAVAMFAGCVYIIYTIVETRALGLQPWKTDVIAMLAHGIDGEGREEMRAAARRGQGLERAAAKGLDVAFEDGGGGLELRTRRRFETVTEYAGGYGGKE